MIPPIAALLFADPVVTGYLGTDPMRLFPFGQTPDAYTKPYATWQTISGTPENTLSAPPPVDHISVQVDVWADSAQDCWEIATAIRDVLELSAHMTYFGNTERATDARSYRQTLTFDFWLNR